MKPLTAAEWLKKNYPHASGWHEDYATEYARDQALEFAKWYIHAIQFRQYMVDSTPDLYTKFLTEQNQQQ